MPNAVPAGSASIGDGTARSASSPATGTTSGSVGGSSFSGSNSGSLPTRGALSCSADVSAL
jgi:hypothetical protein